MPLVTEMIPGCTSAGGNQSHAGEAHQGTPAADQELIRCKVRIDALQQEIKKGIDQRVQTITARVLDENAKLRQEIEQLKAEIAKLKTP